MHRAKKRWPPEHYREITTLFASQGILPVVIGGRNELNLAERIANGGPARSIVGKTTLADIAELARHAAVSVGNDTGPMHIAAICGCPCLVLFSNASNPDITAPRGNDVTILQRQELRDLSVSEVAAALRLR